MFNWNIVAQLLSLALVTLSGPAVIFLLYFKRGNL
uniref:Photosystem II reaction center protein Psb30 n=2 Tax=Emiliania huxleyi TaxID=2903 RepID=PSB30_EMIHU